MGLRSSSLAKKNNQTLTWVLHNKNPSHENSDRKSHEIKSIADSIMPQYREIKYNNHVIHRPRRQRVRAQPDDVIDYGKPGQTYGYGITNLDEFLSKSSIGRPGNIPMVLCAGCLLYQTQLDDHYQTEVALPLGMVVNAVFKQADWLYVQTPHAEEGYIPYKCCLPLGIIPPMGAVDSGTPCWETQSDVFPRPLGVRRSRRTRSTVAGQVESPVTDHVRKAVYDIAPINNDNHRPPRVGPNTLLVVHRDFLGSPSDGTLTVAKGDVLTLTVEKNEPATTADGWFWVRDGRGQEGLVPASLTGYGYL
ncbi:uncharacterized protein LOC126838287 [Adelges cooleyi]|uniref:uncharacterized protein LOC126838287 n=1 Tax=Adelges cooleyi TaxID=133065 RepID=UPI00218036CB|nr:uncharacterized protein LOC126838287 [Adelges cooleyi]